MRRWIVDQSEFEGYWAVGYIDESARDHDGAPTIIIADFITELDDARLIAAAPELLSFANDIIDCLKDFPDMQERLRGVIADGNDLISKVRGAA